MVRALTTSVDGMARDKVRIRFRKGGDLRFVSHHDLMRCFERMLRRAALPFHSTEGFNPKPRLVFALSLALGVVGCDEAAELELDAEIPPEEVHRRLAALAPAGLELLHTRRIDVRTRAQVRRVVYRLAVPPERREGLTERCAELLAAETCLVHRERPQPREVDIQPYLRGFTVRDGALELDFWVTPTGTARPDEVLDLLGLGDLLPAGAVLERIIVELHDEVAAPDAANPQPLSPADAGTAPLGLCAIAALPAAQPEEDA